MRPKTKCVNCEKYTDYSLTTCEHCGCCPFCGQIVSHPMHYCEGGGWNTDRQEKEPPPPNRDDEMQDISALGCGLLVLAIMGMGAFLFQYATGG